MGIPVRRLQNEISSNELSMYMAYDRVDPFTNERMDHGFGLVCSTIARVHGNKNAKASNFMIDYDNVKPVNKSKKEIKHIFGMFARAQNGEKG